MSESALVSMAEQFSGLPMQDLIGGPLNAAVTANGMMAATQTKFLLDTAFTFEAGENGSPDSYTPIMIQMALTQGVLRPGPPSSTKQDPAIETVTTTFNLPLLTILPLNSLAVDDVSIKFDMEVKSSYSETTGKKAEESMSTEGSFSSKFGYGVFSAEITGSASYDSSSTTSFDTHYEKSNSAQYSVSVHAGQIPLPDGVKTILDAFTKSIAPIIMPAEEAITP